MTVKEAITICGGYDYNYKLQPRERIGYFYPTTSLKWGFTVKEYFEKNPEILSREVSRITAIDKNHFGITYYISKEDVEKIKEARA